MTKPAIRLGVNVDHIATLRQARGTRYPDPVAAAAIAELAGAQGITVHLREDRRHIQDRDVELLKKTLNVPMNLEMGVTEEMLGIACNIQPEHCCLVPEKREELTTEGGLDVAGQLEKITDACQRLGAQGIRVSLFIDPEPAQLDAAVKAGAPTVELHTGCYADAETETAQALELERISQAAAYAHNIGLEVHAGHGLTRQNVGAIARIPELTELNIGHALIADAAFMGLDAAVKAMRDAIDRK